MFKANKERVSLGQRISKFLVALLVGALFSPISGLVNENLLPSAAANTPRVTAITQAEWNANSGQGAFTTSSLNSSRSGWEVPIQSSFDDANQIIALGFNTIFNGLTYNSVFIGSNTYVTYGAGSSNYSGLSYSNPNLPGFHLGSADNSYQLVMHRSESSGNTRRIRYEGTQSTGGSLGSPNIVYELIYFKDSSKVYIALGQSKVGGVQGLTNGSTQLAAFPNGDLGGVAKPAFYMISAGPVLASARSATVTTNIGMTITDTITSTGGTGATTIAMNTANTGVSFNAATGVMTVLRNTAGTVTQIFTATDSNNVSATLTVTIRINDPPSASLSSSTITSTVGRTAAETLTVTGGTTLASGGTSDLTFTRQSSNAQTGITLDTSTASAGRAILRVAATGVAAGTYFETITARDNRGATTVSVFTVTVNTAPTVSGARTVANGTLSTTVGVATSETITVVGGTGNKTFSLTQGAVSSAGITLDTSTAASGFAVLRVASNVLANTYLETVTATDASGSAVTYFFRVTVNPVITIGSATTSSFATPSGTAATNTLAVAGGTTPRTMTLTSSPTNAGITLTTGGSGQAVLNIASTVAAATYLETITVTDAVGATAVHVVTLTVSGPIRMDASNATVINTSFGRAASTVIRTVSGNTNKVFTKVTVSPSSSAGITLDTSTASSGFVTLNVSSATSVGTYIESITVVDSSNSRAVATVTINVNPAPVLTFESSTAGSSFSSMSFNGSGAHVTLPANANWQLGSDYTIEWWQYQTGNNAWPRIFSFGSSGLAVSIESGNFYFWNNGANIMNSSSLGNLLNQWIHFAIVSRNNSVIVYMNGVALRSAITLSTVSATQIPTTSRLCIALKCDTGSVGEMFGGQITNFTIDKSARYTGTSTTSANFTPSGFVAVNNTTLVALTSVNSEAKMTDSSSFARIATNVNSPTGSSRHPSSSAASVSVVTTQGLATRSAPFTASSGTGNKTFTLAPTISGITLDTSTANSAVIVLDPSLAATNTTTAATYNESVTATDSLNSSTAFNVVITVNPRIILTAATPSVTTSFGAAAVDTITATANTGTGAITFSLVSNPVSSGITLVANGARSTVLTVARTVPQGTYFETITATDSLGSTTTMAITVTVNPGISLAGAGNISTITTSVGKIASLQVNALNGAASRTFTRQSASVATSAGITLDTTNAASGYAVVRVASTVPANTYLETITVTDSAGGVARLLVTIIVNAAPTLTGPTTVVVTAGKAGSSTVFTTAAGTGAKTFSVSPITSGITIETTTATTAFLRLASTLTSTSSTQARTITETVTATDSAGATANILVTITVNPMVVETATRTSLVTTAGAAIRETITATYGTGNKTFTYSVSPVTAGITLSSTVANQTLLTASNTVLAGTYTITVTATDSNSATADLAITLLVNQSPSIIGNPTFTSTAGYVFTSPTYSAINGSGTKTFTITAANGITLTSSTGTPAIRVADTVTAGTYNITLTATDTASAVATMAIVLTVNAPVTLTGNKTISKVYGEELSQVYQTSSGTAPFNIFTSNICTSEKTTFIGNGTNGILGQSYTVETFNGTGTCNWVAPANAGTASVLVVAGGGGGGSRHSGAGGGGGVLYATNYSLTSGGTYELSVGKGGAGYVGGTSGGSGNTGQNSYFGGSSGTTSIVANGGGGSNANGGSGGGSNYHLTTAGAAAPGSTAGTSRTAGSSTMTVNGVVATVNAYAQAGAVGLGSTCRSVNGSNGWCGGGGGGASAAGDSPALLSGSQYRAGNGGNGIAITINENSVTYAGGGGGGSGSDVSPYSNAATCLADAPREGYGGTGGGGNGSKCLLAASNGTAGLGGGGGGGGYAYYGDSNQNARGGNGGSGTVIVRYLTPVADSSTTQLTMTTLATTPTGSLRLNAPKNLPVATYTQTITVTDANGSTGATPVTVTLTVSKANPLISLSIPNGTTTVSYGSAVSLTATSTIDGSFDFKKGGTTITGCGSVSTVSTVATCSWTPTDTSTALFTAGFTPILGQAGNYNSVTSSSFTLTVVPADTLTVSITDQSKTYTGSAVVVPSQFTFTGLAPIDTITAISRLYTGTANDTSAYSSTTAPTKAGTYLINGTSLTFGGSTRASYYRSIVFVSGDLEIERAANVADFNYRNSNSVTYSLNGIETVTATSLGEALKTYSGTTPDKCSINASTGDLSLLEAGTCSVTMEIAEGFNYLTTTVTKNVTIAKASRTISVTSSAATIKYGDTATVTTTISAGALDGVISYTSSSPTSCTFDAVSGELTATSGSGTCGLTAQIAEGINYLGETSTALSVTAAKANGLIIISDTMTAAAYTGSTISLTPTFTVTGLKFADAVSTSLTFTYSNLNYTAYSSTTAPTQGGLYRITPSGVSLTTGSLLNYNAPTYLFSDWEIEQINQPALLLENFTGELSFPLRISTTGGATSTPAVTFTAVNGSALNCRAVFGPITGSGGVSVWSLQADSAGSCSVIATKPSDRNFRSVVSETATVTVISFTVYVPPVIQNQTTGITITPTVPVTKGPTSCTSGCVPTITAVSPFTGYVGDIIVLTGTNLTGTTKVIFNVFTEATNFTVDSDTQITVQIPAGLPAGEMGIEVVAPGGTSSRNFDLEIL
jgi:hypothetical protein